MCWKKSQLGKGGRTLGVACLTHHYTVHGEEDDYVLKKSSAERNAVHLTVRGEPFDFAQESLVEPLAS